MIEMWCGEGTSCHIEPGRGSLAMGSRGYRPESTVVLTTEERFDLFEPVLGKGVDARFNPQQTVPLKDFLFNCAASRGTLVVIDEAHFIHPEDMVDGIREYLDAQTEPAARLTIVPVCSQRTAGDELLFYFATYCGIYDIVYGHEGAELTVALAEVLRHPKMRHEVIELIRTNDALPFSQAMRRQDTDAIETLHAEESVARHLNIKIEIR